MGTAPGVDYLEEHRHSGGVNFTSATENGFPVHSECGLR